MLNRLSLPQGSVFVLACAGLFAISACTERSLSGPERSSADPDKVADLVTPLTCTATVSTGNVACENGLKGAAGGATSRIAPAGDSGMISKDIIGGQNGYVKLTSSNVSYNSGTEIFQFDVTVQNLLNEAIGTPDGNVPDPQGVRAFFFQDPVATSGSGTITVANADGTATFLSTNEPYYQYNGILVKNATSAGKTWQFSIPPTVGTFAFSVYLSANVQRLLVINEVMANPGGVVQDSIGEYVEVYNAGTLAVNLQNMVIADLTGATRNPYHLINSSVPVASGGYVVLGRSANTAKNGGIPVDYAYGIPSTSTQLTFSNSAGDAIMIARVFGTDTLTVDRAQYASAAIAAKAGISRELKNPALDNSNIDDSNWADALSTSVYSPSNRGTPRTENSTFVP